MKKSIFINIGSIRIILNIFMAIEDYIKYREFV